MTPQILITAHARKDFDDIVDYLFQQAGKQQADAVQDALESVIVSLRHLPGRGNIPPEMEKLGIRSYRELHCPPYRIIYEQKTDAIYIHAILDARRNVQDLLTRRQLR